MVDRQQALTRATVIIQGILKTRIISSNLDLEGGQLACVLDNGLRLYIVYNTAGQYAYQIMKSLKKGEFVRFDNFDDKWNVKTKPNHFHPYKVKQPRESPMTGDPEKDLKMLCKWIISGKLFNPEFEPYRP